jgi:nuclear transport factor 2 (NTF2) superfamily protein
MTTETTATRPPLPPFTRETAVQKVRLAEDGWNTRDPESGTRLYNRLAGEIAPNFRMDAGDIQFLKRKAKSWTTGSSKNSGVTGNRIAVRFAYEWHDIRSQVSVYRNGMDSI